MIRRCLPKEGHGRRGAALMALVIILAFLSFLLATMGRQMLAHRHYLKHREQQLQADWLARAGIELAIARLLADPTYAGDTVALIPDSRVQVKVTNERVPADMFRITCEVRLPADDRKGVSRSVHRQFRRLLEGDQIRLAPVK
jgi:hypothetical protein